MDFKTKLAKILSEMPVTYRSDLPPEDDDSTFSWRDRRILGHARTARKLGEYFAKSRFNWNIVVSESPDEIEPEPDAITFVLHGSPQGGTADPMTPWMIAHRIGHALYPDDTISFYAELEPVYDIDRLVLSIGKVVLVAAGQWQNYMPLDDSLDFDEMNELQAAILSALTMGSARTGKLDNGNEMRYELVAQYLVTGRVTLKGASRAQSALTDLARRIEATIDRDCAAQVGQVLVAGDD